MEKAKCFFSIFYAFSFFFLIMGTGGTANGCGHGEQRRSTKKLFVFGDSYADTGNLGRIKNLARSWYEPYGMTFPRKPTGRFSDGRVLADYVASFLRIRSPIPYKIRRFDYGHKLLPYGMNFAVGGSGVFDTGNFQHNLTTQIDEFHSQIHAGVFSAHDIKSSCAAALVVISGNDYAYLAAHDPNYLLHLNKFMDHLFKQLKRDLERLDRLGVPRVILSNLHPIECTPYYTRSSNYTSCPLYISLAVAAHNQRVDELIKELGGASNSTTFMSLDVNAAFLNALGQVNGTEKKVKYPLVPCCESSSNATNCGEVNKKGRKLYRVCSRPEYHFYWDSVHPTQAGWAAAFEFLKPALRRFFRI